MKPFRISEVCFDLVDTYPNSENLLAVALAMNRAERECVLRLWVTEGIPFGFREAPIVYETVRGWLAGRLGVNPKEITLIGSARLGYSLVKAPNYGRQFGSHSDMDLTVISEPLFLQLVDTFNDWKDEFSDGRIQPRNETERGYWEENINRLVPDNISRGFIDKHLIPNRYPSTQNISQAMYILGEKLKVTARAPQVRKASVRVYRSWDAFIAQISLNFWTTLMSFRKATH